MLTNDKVSNVRMRICRILPEVKKTLLFPTDKVCVLYFNHAPITLLIVNPPIAVIIRNIGEKRSPSIFCGEEYGRYRCSG